MGVFWSLGTSALCLWEIACGAATVRTAPASPEHNLAELIAVAPQLEEMQLEIAKAVVASRTVVLLVDEGNAEELLGRVVGNETLRNAYMDGALHVQTLRFDTPWIRDYGPLISMKDGRIGVLDATYAMSKRADGADGLRKLLGAGLSDPNWAKLLERAKDDQVPLALEAALRDHLGGHAVRQVGVRIDGGNLIRLRNDTCVSTSDIAEDLAADHLTLEAVASALECKQLVLLEPLPGTPIKHVDMFLAPARGMSVMLADYSDSVHSVLGARANEAMHRNAVTLANHHIDVVWVPALEPSSHGATAIYPTLMNMLIIDRRGEIHVVMPSYVDRDADVQSKAQQIVRGTLHAAELHAVESGEAAKQFGAVHCLTSELPWSNDNPSQDASRKQVVAAVQERLELAEKARQSSLAERAREEKKRERQRRVLEELATHVWVKEGIRAWLDGAKLALCLEGEVVYIQLADEILELGDNIAMSGTVDDEDDELQIEFRPKEGELVIVSGLDRMSFHVDKLAARTCVADESDKPATVTQSRTPADNVTPAEP